MITLRNFCRAQKTAKKNCWAFSTINIFFAPNLLFKMCFKQKPRKILGSITKVVFSQQNSRDFLKIILDSESWESGASILCCSTQTELDVVHLQPKRRSKNSENFWKFFTDLKTGISVFFAIFVVVVDYYIVEQTKLHNFVLDQKLPIFSQKKVFFDHETWYQNGQKVANFFRSKPET